MKKLIIVDGQKVEMTFEETLKRFEGMVTKEVNKHVNTTEFNGIEREDLHQALTLYVWKAYEDYEVERGLAFSTLLYNYLRDGKRRETYHLFAEKRTAEYGVYSIDEESEQDSSFYETYADSLTTESYFEEKELHNLVYEGLSEMERDVLEILLCEVEGVRADKKGFANKWGFSRPKAYRVISEISESLRTLVLKNGYSL